jgi:hypothetical protein
MYSQQVIQSDSRKAVTAFSLSPSSRNLLPPKKSTKYQKEYLTGGLQIAFAPAPLSVISKKSTSHFFSNSLPRKRQSPLAQVTKILWPTSSWRWIPDITSLSPAVISYLEAPPNLVSIVNSGKILGWLEILRFHPKCIAPMGDGGICIAWPMEGFYADISCFNDGDITLSFRERGLQAKTINNPSFFALRQLTELISGKLVA